MDKTKQEKEKLEKQEKEKIEKQEKPKEKKIEVKKNNKKKISINFEEENKKLKEQITTLKISNINLEAENQKNLIEFQSLAKTFQTKAQEQINIKSKEFSKKLEEEKKLIKKYGSQKMLESIIEPILNIEAAVKAGKSQEAVSAYVMGFEMLLGQLYQELESFGVVSIDPKPGDEFNPELHFIMSQVDGNNKNQIKEIKKKGFKLYDRILKPAIVITFK